MMMYPFLQLDDMTEIVHSEMQSDGSVKVYVEKPIDGAFQSAWCILPNYEWKDIYGFSEADIRRYQEVLESVAPSASSGF